ncbi:MAG: biotin/lipoyl-containing protein [Desertimonas sp.]
MAEIKAELNGVVREIISAAGAVVAEGDDVMIVESMKMEIPVVAPCAGTVSAVAVAVDEAVVKGQLLVTLDPA